MLHCCARALICMSEKRALLRGIAVYLQDWTAAHSSMLFVLVCIECIVQCMTPDQGIYHSMQDFLMLSDLMPSVSYIAWLWCSILELCWYLICKCNGMHLSSCTVADICMPFCLHCVVTTRAGLVDLGVRHAASSQFS